MSKQTQLTALFAKKRKESPVDLSTETLEPKKLNEVSQSRDFESKILLDFKKSSMNSNYKGYCSEILDERQVSDKEDKCPQDLSEKQIAQKIKEENKSAQEIPDQVSKPAEIEKVSNDKLSQADKRKFQQEWLKEFQGLQYDQKNDLMFCEICRNYFHASRVGSNVFIEGTSKKTTDVLRYHWTQHKGHKAALEASNESKNSKKIYDNLIIKNETKNIILMKISYFLCKNTRSFNKFAEITDLIFHQILDRIRE